MKKNWGYNHATVCSIIRKILECDIEFWYKNISIIRNVRFIFQNFQKNFQKQKKIEKIPMDSKKSNQFIWNKKKIGYLIIYRMIIFLGNLLITFRHCTQKTCTRNIAEMTFEFVLECCVYTVIFTGTTP